MIAKSYITDTPRFNNLACPKCGEELIDDTPYPIANYYPLRKNIHCSKCSFTGQKYE